MPLSLLSLMLVYKFFDQPPLSSHISFNFTKIQPYDYYLYSSFCIPSCTFLFKCSIIYCWCCCCCFAFCKCFPINVNIQLLCGRVCAGARARTHKYIFICSKDYINSNFRDKTHNFDALPSAHREHRTCSTSDLYLPFDKSEMRKKTDNVMHIL